MNDLKECELISNPQSDLNDLVNAYNRELGSIFDKQAPVTVRKVVLHPHAPWYMEHIRQAKVERHRAERKWCKDRTTINKQILKSK